MRDETVVPFKTWAMEPPFFLNVGGIYFVTRKSTLASVPFFASLLHSLDENAYEAFLDRDPSYFRHVLNWMRGVHFVPGDVCTIRELVWEAEFYGMQDMQDALLHSGGVSVPHVLKGIHETLKHTSSAPRRRG